MYQFSINILGQSLKVCDYSNSKSVGYIERDLNKDVYGISNIIFQENDYVIDLGANNGMFSAFLALKYPYIKIIAIEARSDNYNHLVSTLAINNIKNVIPLNIAIAMNERDIVISGGTENSGGGSIYSNWWGNVDNPEIIENCPTISLDKLFKMFGIGQCKLLKCDIEGAEYEVFLNTTKLKDIGYISAEIHPPPSAYKNFSKEKLVEYIKNNIINPNNLIIGES